MDLKSKEIDKICKKNKSCETCPLCVGEDADVYICVADIKLSKIKYIFDGGTVEV